MRRRIIIATLFSVVVVLVSLGVVTNLSVENEISHSLRQSLELATVTGNHTDALLRSNMARLYDISLSGAVDFSDGDAKPELAALKTAFDYSIFADGVFALDATGRRILAYPQAAGSEIQFSGMPELGRVLEEGRPLYTGLLATSESDRRALLALVPLKDKAGRPAGVAAGQIDPNSPVIQNLVQSSSDHSRFVVELVDQAGVVIASSNPDRVFSCSDRSRYLERLIATHEKAVFKCHRCHEDRAGSMERSTDVLAFAPLQEAPWGIAVREPESDTFESSMALRRRFLALGLIVFASALALAAAISRSVVNPVRALTEAAVQIAGGELAKPIHVDSKDEIGTLGRSFETMRWKLADSLESLKGSNLKLERRIADRTRQLQESKERLATLLHKVMSAQEDERKRIARELHDETLQAAAALGLAIEMASTALGEGRLAPGDLMRLKSGVEQLIDGINALIQDLRPPMLDDLGLPAAVRWLIDKRLAAKGIETRFKCSEEFRRNLAKARADGILERVDLTLFRILQEAIVNVAKHSKASKVSVALLGSPDGIRILVQDNGIGFNCDEVWERARRGRSAGFGILGLQERASLLGAELTIDSTPGSGTSVSVSVSLPERREQWPSE